jgi:hypothetical protein
VKFKPDIYGDRTLDFKDHDGDSLKVENFVNDGGYMVVVNGMGVLIGRKKLRKLAKQILKETRK